MNNILINILLVLIFLIIFKLTIVEELFTNQGIQSGEYKINGASNYGSSSCYINDDQTMICDNNTSKSNEEFNIINLNNGKYAIKKNNKFCHIKENEIICENANLDNSGKFFLNNIEGDYYSIKGLENNLYCTNNKSKIACNKESVSNMERFKLTMLEGTEDNLGQQIDINVGSSSRKEKEIELPKMNLSVNAVPINEDLLDKNIKFKTVVNGKTLTIIRIDRDSGWNDDIILKATEITDNKEATTDIFKYRTVAIGKNNKYLKINDDGTVSLSNIIGKNETFEVINVGGSVFALKSKNRKYLSIGKTSISSNHFISTDEKFVVLLLGKYTLIKSLANNTFVSINKDMTVSAIGFTTEGTQIDIMGLKLKEEKPDEEMDDSYFDQKIPEDTSGYTMTGQQIIDKKCSFIPRGPTELACQDRCLNKYDNKLWGGEECTTEVCEDICKKCNKPEDCLWLEQTAPREYKPEPLRIRGISMDKKVKIFWKNIPNKFSQTGKFAIMINNLTDRNSTPRVDVLTDSECTNCEHYVSNLENFVKYEIKVVARNQYGFSENSNTIILTPEPKDPADVTAPPDTTSDQQSTETPPTNYYNIDEYKMSQNEMNDVAYKIIMDRLRPNKQLDINLFT